MSDRITKLKETDKQVCLLLSEKDIIPHKQALDMYEVLKSGQYFTTARRLMERIETTAPDSEKLKIGQKRSLCTYKDTTLRAPDRFDDALAILNQCDDLSSTRNQETLGQAGAIYKNKWLWDGRKQHLEYSFEYYRRGANVGIREDSGYTAINAAYVLDLLAREEEQLVKNTASESKSNISRRDEAKRIRREIIDILTIPPEDEKERQKYIDNSKEWWFKATLAEAYFGEGDFDLAEKYLNKRHEKHVADWELESTARQLAALYILLHEGSKKEPRALSVLSGLFGDTSLLYPLTVGKVGLALSGGGFRAALFHIGVLARLAEMDMLRHVEVISCVSGGSIIGTCYTLALKKLLESKADSLIQREDYIKLVQELAEKFPAGVQQNLRLRLFASIGKSIKMLRHTFTMNYTHTHRMGELYEEHLFNAYAAQKKGAHLQMQDLCINPKGKSDERPKDYNWKRQAKVPTLIINATTLNTGHNWQFIPTWMGEPPESVDADICVNERLRRMYYDEAPEQFRSVPLGMAVAASSGVPVIFPPIGLKKLYQDRVVRLVDGGVYDNQGVAGLMEQGCLVFLVSDASGQMQTTHKPSISLVSIASRANDIQATRLRVTQYRELSDRATSTQKNVLCFLHLMDGLNEPAVDWIGCQQPSQSPPEKSATLYGIFVKCQRALARIRTDLDSFSDIEANSLMLSGYRLADHTWTKNLREMFPSQCSPSPNAWSFQAASNAIVNDSSTGNSAPDKRVLSWLEVGSKLFFKMFVYWFRKLPIPTLKTSCFVTLPLLSGYIFVEHGLKKSATALLFLLLLPLLWLCLTLILAVVRAVVLKIYLLTVDRLFLCLGKMTKLSLK